MKARAAAIGRITTGRAQQIERELALIEKLDLEGYFLIVWDIVRFCREHNILVQGRGSAANSAVCYSLGITAVDPVGMELLFERFLSEERGEWPDIDLDLPSGDKRERAIQYVYERYGKLRRGHDRQRHHLSRTLRRARSRARRWASTSTTLDKSRQPGARIWGWKDPERHDASASFAMPASIFDDPRIRKFFELVRWRCRICRAISASIPAAW